MKKLILLILPAFLFLYAETLFQVKDSQDRVVLDISSDGLRVLNEGDTVMVISSSEIKAVIDDSKALSRSFTVATSTSAKGHANVLEVTTQDTKMREGTEGNQYTEFSPQNTFIGLRAGTATNPDLYPTDNYGKRNIFIGYESGRNNIIGYQNVFIGDSTGYNTAATTSTTQNAVRNVFIGTSSGFSNREGDVNTFVGYLAGYSNNKNGGSASGICNTYIGANSGRANIDGTFNTFMGYYSGFKMTEGSSNVMLGQRSGQNKTSGDNNTMVGANAGSSNSTGSSNVFLGYYAGANETGSNKLYIANSSTSTPLIKGTFPNNDLTFTANSVEVVHAMGETVNGLKIQTTYSGNTDSWHFYQQTDDELGLYYNTGLRGSYNITSGAYTSVSDRKFKKNIMDVGKVKEKLLKLSPKKYNFVTQDDSGEMYIGLIAQEVKELFPEFVHYHKESDSYTMDYSGMSVVAIQAIKEQQSEIDELRKEIMELKNLIKK
jgi:hypothetical protein